MRSDIVPGARFPDYDLPDQDGLQRRLSDLQASSAYCGYWFWGRPSGQEPWRDLGDVLRTTCWDFDPTMPAARARLDIEP